MIMRFSLVSLLITVLLVIISLLYAQQAGWRYLVFTKTVDPDTIWLEGSGIQPETSTVTLRVTCAGKADTFYSHKSDVMLVLDNSGSMGGVDPIRSQERCIPAKAAAIGFINNLGTDDRVGAMIYAHWGQPDPGFTGAFDTIADFKTHTEFSAVASAIMDKMTCDGNGTATYWATWNAAKYVLENKRPDVVPVVIVMTDGEDNCSAGGCYGDVTPVAPTTMGTNSAPEN
jgi:hypothetical protein